MKSRNVVISEVARVAQWIARSAAESTGQCSADRLEVRVLPRVLDNKKPKVCALGFFASAARGREHRTGKTTYIMDKDRFKYFFKS